MKKCLNIADLFCGAGGTSTGAIQAANEAGYTTKLTAINHWPVAVKTHEQNHPDARHLCASLDALNPRDLYRENELDILWGSPECTHHSNARGGRPMNDQSRATAWCIVRWAEALRPGRIYVENVPEFLSWGPIGSNGRPLASRKGDTFRAWVSALESLGYTVSHRILCAADYGDPTTRQRLFVQAVRGNRRISWPTPTHAEGDSLFGTPRWRSAAEIIDWNIKGHPVSLRKKKLCKNTLQRIRAGLERFGGRPFVVAWDNQSSKRAEWDVNDPLSTITTKARHGVCEPFIVKMRGTDVGHIANSAQSIRQPIDTISAGGLHHALCEPFLVQTNHAGGDRVKSLGEFALCEPFIVQYYGNGEARSIDSPLDTVTTHDRFGLVEPMQEGDVVDVRFRMLQPHELAAAQGFPRGYKFAGNKTEIVKQIGNAVPCGLARALVRASLANVAKVAA